MNAGIFMFFVSIDESNNGLIVAAVVLYKIKLSRFGFQTVGKIKLDIWDTGMYIFHYFEMFYEPNNRLNRWYISLYTV